MQFLFIDKEPISLTYANAKSNPSHQEAPTKLSDLKPRIFVVWFSTNKQTKKKKLLESKTFNLQTKSKTSQV